MNSLLVDIRTLGPAPGKCRSRLSILALFAVLLVTVSGCATKFVAKAIDPLKPPDAVGWNAGELSETTRARLAALGLPRNWKDDPRAALVALEAGVGKDPAARRAVIEVALAAGIRAHARFLTDRGAAGLYLCAAEHAFDAAGQGDADFQRFCREVSRYAVGRLASLREIAQQKGFAIENEIAGPTRTYRIEIRSNVRGAVGLDKFHVLLAADSFKIVGARDLALVQGAGTPLVGRMRGSAGADAAKRFAVQDGLWLPFTATVQFGPRGPRRLASFTIYDRRNVETAQIGARPETLAADFSTPFAVRTRELNQKNLLTLGILGFLRGDQFFDQSGLYPLEFPRTDKIPVIFVHGLISEPNDWRFLHNALLADPQIRQRYQFWAFYYPTSVPVPWSATILRRELGRVRQSLNPGGGHGPLGHMILLGHSMGGLVSRMQIVDGGDSFYRQYFTRPVDQLRLTADERRMIQEMFYFSANPDIDEVVCVCVPHQGSFLATNWVGKIARRLARLPLTVVQTSVNMLTFNADALAADAEVNPGTSIDSLSPGGKFAAVLQTLPLSPRVKKFSIIGDRGQGGDPWRTSDGVVPYWSSHLEGVPETIIPSNHSGPEHPRCADEIKRLLRVTP
ncbi:MAG: hypothetical protein QOE70_1529 [Chthoniobacter sp.]|jgi:hypothetical protein|nr:hypothetical protein [Chthoniobacter sp.]